MKNSIQILTATTFDNFSAALDKTNNQIIKSKAKARLSFFYFIAVFSILIFLFAK